MKQENSYSESWTFELEKTLWLRIGLNIIEYSSAKKQNEHNLSVNLLVFFADLLFPNKNHSSFSNALAIAKSDDQVQ